MYLEQRTEHLAGEAIKSTGPICVGPSTRLRVHIIANGTGTGTVLVKQGDTNVSADLKTTQTITNPAAGANWIVLEPSNWIEIDANLSAGTLKKVVVVWGAES